jgi:hypothetical protein
MMHPNGMLRLAQWLLLLSVVLSQAGCQPSTIGMPPPGGDTALVEVPLPIGERLEPDDADQPEQLTEAYWAAARRCLGQGRHSTALAYAKLAWEATPRCSEEQTLLLAEAFMRNDSLERAERLALSLTMRGTEMTRYQAYRLLMWMASTQADQRYTRLYSDSAIHCLETIYRQTMQERERMLMETERLRHRTSMYIWVGFSLLLVLLTCLVAALTIHRTRITAARRQLRYEQERQASQQSQITLLRKQLLSRIDLMKRLDEERRADRRITLSADDWADLELVLDEAYDGFSTRLRNSYPQLTEKEVRFCMLVRLGLTNHELTNVYSISEASMKQRLFDYKARLGLTDPAVSLRRFLTTF